MIIQPAHLAAYIAAAEIDVLNSLGSGPALLEVVVVAVAVDVVGIVVAVAVEGF